MGHSLVNFLDDKNLIVDFLDSRSQVMFKYVNNSASRFSLWYKNLAHSDLTNRGKRNGSHEGLEKNLLYYLSVPEMKAIGLFEHAGVANHPGDLGMKMIAERIFSVMKTYL